MGLEREVKRDLFEKAGKKDQNLIRAFPTRHGTQDT